MPEASTDSAAAPKEEILSQELSEYYFHDPRVILVPVEHLGPAGVSPGFAEQPAARVGLGADAIELLSRGFALYWQRSEELARSTETWPQPARRHIAIVREPDAVSPYNPILATAWTLYESDLHPGESHPELVCFLLTAGDFMMYLGEVARVPIYSAAYWLQRAPEEIAAFADAAQRCRRPDAAAYAALADATSWLPELYHETLRPPTVVAPGEAVPGTGLFVPERHSRTLVEMAETWRKSAISTVAGYRAKWRDSDLEAVRETCAWLAEDAPPLLVTAESGKVIWDPDASLGVGRLRSELKRRSGAAVRDVAADLRLIAEHTHRFLGCIDADALPMPDEDIEASGYTYLHRERRAIAYNLDEKTIDRRHGPALPYARAMLGARTIHEWGHLAADAGFVPHTIDAAEIAARNAALAEALTAAIADAPDAIRMITAENLQTLIAPPPDSAEAKLPRPPGAPETPAGGLVRLLHSRMTDFQSNLVAERFLTRTEQETYVRQNIRPLRMAYDPPAFWRMVVRLLYEYQYLRFSQVPDKRDFFLGATDCYRDFFHTKILSEAHFDRLIEAVGRICDGYAVDDTKIRTPS